MCIFTIIVTYNANLDNLKKLLFSLENQVNGIVIVNNCEKELLIEKSKKVSILHLNKNYGIAYAQNIGIDYSIKKGAEYILFSDQDTVFPDDYICRCYNTYVNQSAKNNKIAAIVPLFYNENKDQLSQIMITKTKAINAEKGKIYSLAHAISSGSFVPIEAINKIGLMNERMFIDFVDNEWCWRANKHGYKVLCDSDIIINHSMGDNYKEIFGRKIVKYSNFRNYFYFRNSYYLLFHSGLLNIKEFFGFLIFTKVKAMLYFLVSGVSFKNIKIYIKAKYKGIFNKFSLEEEINEKGSFYI